jgi:RNA polymerase sigma-70 factor, ECF subfamily
MSGSPPSVTAVSGSTSSSLLEGVKARDANAWSKFSRLYSPLVYRWARQMGLQATDATDVVQEVFRAVTTHVAEFRRERPSDSFRGWLWTITRNKVRDHFRRRGTQPVAEGGSEGQRRLLEVPDGLPDDEASLTSASAHAELTHRIMELVRAEFEPRTWQAFWRTAVDGLAPAEVAGELGIKIGSVYMAKSRVLTRLRQELSGLMEG